MGVLLTCPCPWGKATRCPPRVRSGTTGLACEIGAASIDAAACKDGAATAEGRLPRRPTPESRIR